MRFALCLVIVATLIAMGSALRCRSYESCPVNIWAADICAFREKDGAFEYRNFNSNCHLGVFNCLHSEEKLPFKTFTKEHDSCSEISRKLATLYSNYQE